jgi:hypothetical protein
MSNIPVAFLVLGAFFSLYLVAALWRSRPMHRHGQDARRRLKP